MIKNFISAHFENWKVQDCGVGSGKGLLVELLKTRGRKEERAKGGQIYSFLRNPLPQESTQSCDSPTSPFTLMA